MSKKSLLLLFFMLTSSAFSQSASEYNVYILDIPPYGFLNQNNVAGLYFDIAEEIAKEAKIKFNYFLVPFARAEKSVMEEKKSLTFMFDTDIVSTKAQKIAPLFKRSSFVITSLQQKPNSKPEDLKNEVIGRLANGCADLEKMNVGNQFVTINSFSSGLSMLLKGRLNGVCGTQEALSFYLKKGNFKLAQFGPMILISKRVVYLHASKDVTPKEVLRFKQAVYKIKVSKKLKKIIANSGLKEIE